MDGGRLHEIEARVNDTLNGPGRAEHETGGWRLAAKHADDSRWLVARVRDLEAALRDTDDMISDAWGIICNAGEGDWTTQTEEWQVAAARFRDRFHAYLDSRPSAVSSPGRSERDA